VTLVGLLEAIIDCDIPNKPKKAVNSIKMNYGFEAERKMFTSQ